MFQWRRYGSVLALGIARRNAPRVWRTANGIVTAGGALIYFIDLGLRSFPASPGFGEQLPELLSNQSDCERPRVAPGEYWTVEVALEKPFRVQVVMSMKMIFTDRRFWPLFWTQFQGALNDNVFKNAMVMMVTFQGVSVAGLDKWIDRRFGRWTHYSSIFPFLDGRGSDLGPHGALAARADHQVLGSRDHGFGGRRVSFSQLCFAARSAVSGRSASDAVRSGEIQHASLIW